MHVNFLYCDVRVTFKQIRLNNLAHCQKNYVQAVIDLAGHLDLVAFAGEAQDGVVGYRGAGGGAVGAGQKEVGVGVFGVGDGGHFDLRFADDFECARPLAASAVDAIGAAVYNLGLAVALFGERAFIIRDRRDQVTAIEFV